MANVDRVNSSPELSETNQDFSVLLFRVFSWSVVAVLFAFLINNYLTVWRLWPGAGAIFQLTSLNSGKIILTIIQSGIYAALIAGVFFYVAKSRQKGLRADSVHFYDLTAYVIRAAFWAVFLIGLIDMIISFLRVEDMLVSMVGKELADNLNLSSFRGTWIHFPLFGLSFIIAIFYRGLGFPWLALLVVVIELLIVIASSVYSYAKPISADLVRFWYAALFLFASAYTLLEEGHVRVDLLYAGMSRSTKGIVNALGSILLGMSLCWVILFYGMGSSRSIINAPFLVFEGTQQGIGMQVNYWMAGFLAMFAISMLIQFAGYFLESMADFRDEPGAREKPQELAGEMN